eukprot:COSAG05_NODE_110_length_18660_cov_2.692635_2_plen_1196_part_00
MLAQLKLQLLRDVEAGEAKVVAEDTERRVAALEQQLREADDRNATAAQDLASAESTIATQHAEMLQVQEVASAKARALLQAEAELAKGRAEQAQSRKDATLRDEELRAIKVEASNVAAAFTAARVENQRLGSELTQATEAALSSREHAEQMEAACSEKSQDVDRIQAQVESIKRHTEMVERELAEAKPALETSQSQVRLLQRQLRDAVAENADANRRAETAHENTQRLREETRELEQASVRQLRLLQETKAALGPESLRLQHLAPAAEDQQQEQMATDEIVAMVPKLSSQRPRADSPHATQVATATVAVATAVERTLAAHKQQLVLRLQHHDRFKAFNSWRNNARQQRHINASARRIVGRMRNACVLGAFSRWEEFRQQKHQVRRIGSRLMNLCLSRAFGSWGDAAATRRVEAREAAHLQELQALRDEIHSQQSVAATEATELRAVHAAELAAQVEAHEEHVAHMEEETQVKHAHLTKAHQQSLDALADGHSVALNAVHMQHKGHTETLQQKHEQHKQTLMASHKKEVEMLQDNATAAMDSAEAAIMDHAAAAEAAQRMVLASTKSSEKSQADLIAVRSEHLELKTNARRQQEQLLAQHALEKQELEVGHKSAVTDLHQEQEALALVWAREHASKVTSVQAEAAETMKEAIATLTHEHQVSAERAATTYRDDLARSEQREQQLRKELSNAVDSRTHAAEIMMVEAEAAQREAHDTEAHQTALATAAQHLELVLETARAETATQCDALRAEYEDELSSVRETGESEISELTAAHKTAEKEMDSLMAAHEEVSREMQVAHESEARELREAHEASVSEVERQVVLLEEANAALLQDALTSEEAEQAKHTRHLTEALAVAEAKHQAAVERLTLHQDVELEALRASSAVHAEQLEETHVRSLSSHQSEHQLQLAETEEASAKHVAELQREILRLVDASQDSAIAQAAALDTLRETNAQEIAMAKSTEAELSARHRQELEEAESEHQAALAAAEGKHAAILRQHVTRAVQAQQQARDQAEQELFAEVGKRRALEVEHAGLLDMHIASRDELQTEYTAFRATAADEMAGERARHEQVVQDLQATHCAENEELERHLSEMHAAHTKSTAAAHQFKLDDLNQQLVLTHSTYNEKLETQQLSANSTYSEMLQELNGQQEAHRDAVEKLLAEHATTVSELRGELHLVVKRFIQIRLYARECSLIRS